MKKTKNILCILFMMLVFMFLPTIFNLSCVKCAYAESSDSSGQSNKPSSEDWKIVVDEKESSNEFDFIQKNIASLDLSDNGKSLLVIGIILIVISVLGIIFSSLMLYKISILSKRRLNRRLLR